MSDEPETETEMNDPAEMEGEDDSVIIDPIERVQLYDQIELSTTDLRMIEDCIGLVSGIDLAARIETEHERLRRADRDDALVMFTHGEVVRIATALLSGWREIERTGIDVGVDGEQITRIGKTLLDIEVDEEDIPEAVRVGSDIEMLADQFDQDQAPSQTEIAELVGQLRNV